MVVDQAKRNGVHYTPAGLARFLAARGAEHVTPAAKTLKVLDPACGDGSLLEALAEYLSPQVLAHSVLVGYETDGEAVVAANERLARFPVEQIDLRQQDFLDAVADRAMASTGGGLFASGERGDEELFDIVIANPPYVRTQVLGADKAQALADKFDLHGRVDLYHAFTKAMSWVLRPGGVLALLTSNRFLVTQAGASLRRFLLREFQLRAVYDLGDTKLFSAAVLPVIIVATKAKGGIAAECPFIRAYECRHGAPADPAYAPTVLDVLGNGFEGHVRTEAGTYRIERGLLATSSDGAQPWTLHTTDITDWLGVVERNRACTFEEAGVVRVGIKTTADSVFVRTDWESLPIELQPEAEVLFPLITHHITGRWRVTHEDTNRTRVLYTHRVVGGKRQPIDLAEYPRCRAYLESHRTRLEGREYVLKAGRKWYEIWVPQNPTEWAKPKIVFPDIAETARFSLDLTGAVVNGDCYWFALQPGQPEDQLFLMLAVANSSFITEYYDRVFHNKLYAGRRRFMTQYVSKFPLPYPDGPAAREIVRIVRKLADGNSARTSESELSDRLDVLVWESFGLAKEPAR